MKLKREYTYLKTFRVEEWFGKRVEMQDKENGQRKLWNNFLMSE
jgi:hypothetical protein